MRALRTPPISLRLTAAERSALEAAAGDRPVSQVLRERALAGLDIPPAPAPVAQARRFARPPDARIPSPDLVALAPLAGQLGRQRVRWCRWRGRCGRRGPVRRCVEQRRRSSGNCSWCGRRPAG